MLWLACTLALSAQQEAEILDLEDALDAVNPTTRDAIEAAIERRHDLFELPFLLEDLAFAPRTRDRTIAFFARFSFGRRETRSTSAFLLGVTLDFDAMLLSPEPEYGMPPEERLRLDRCAALVAPQPVSPSFAIARARAAELAALACGGAG